MSGARPGVQWETGIPEVCGETPHLGRQGSQVGRSSQATLHLPGSTGLLGLLSREAKAQNMGLS